MNYDKHDAARSAVSELLSGLSKMNESPHYSLGYLESMLTKWAYDSNTVFDEIVSTNEWLNTHNKAVKNAEV